jgi:hypothetical protein
MARAPHPPIRLAGGTVPPGDEGDGFMTREHLTTATTLYREMDMRFWLEQVDHGQDELPAQRLLHP